MEYEYYLEAVISYRFKRAPIGRNKVNVGIVKRVAWVDEVTIEAPDYTPSGLLETELRKHLAAHFQQEGKKLVLSRFGDTGGA